MARRPGRLASWPASPAAAPGARQAEPGFETGQNRGACGGQRSLKIIPPAEVSLAGVRKGIPFVQPVSGVGHGTGVATEGLRRARWPVGSSWASSWSMSTVMVPISPMVPDCAGDRCASRVSSTSRPWERSWGLRSPDEESNGYASDLRLGRNFHREVDHFRYVLPGLFRRGARRQVEARAAKSAWACSMASGYAWVLSCTASAR